eukprot:scaffold1381_cov386-Prasinococcus_capsulatus_cf.AAC.8
MAAAQQQQQFFARAQPLCSTVLRAVPSQDLGTATEAVRSLQQQIAEAPAALFAFDGPREGDAEGHPAIEGASGSPGDTAPDFLDVLMLPLLLVLDAHYPLDGDTSAALAKRGASQLCEASLECLEELLGKSTVTGPQVLPSCTRLLPTIEGSVDVAAVQCASSDTPGLLGLPVPAAVAHAGTRGCAPTHCRLRGGVRRSAAVPACLPSEQGGRQAGAPARAERGIFE